MKNTFVLWLLLFVFVSCDQQSTTEEQTAIDTPTVNMEIDSVKNLVRGSFEDIWSNLDSTKIEVYHTDDFMLLENGIVWDNDSIRNFLNKERIEMESQKFQRLNRFHFIKSVHNQSSIWVAYDNYGTWVTSVDTLGTVHWLESVIAVKDQGKWKLQQMHSTRVRK